MANRGGIPLLCSCLPAFSLFVSHGTFRGHCLSGIGVTDSPDYTISFIQNSSHYHQSAGKYSLLEIEL